MAIIGMYRSLEALWCLYTLHGCWGFPKHYSIKFNEHESEVLSGPMEVGKQVTRNGVRKYIQFVQILFLLKHYLWKAIAPEASNGGTLTHLRKKGLISTVCTCT